MTRKSAGNFYRYLGWGLLLSGVPFVWWACTSHPLTQPVPEPQQQTNLYISVSPLRQLDMVFMIDNSPSMAPKQEKLKEQFPKLIDALKDPTTGALPDLRVAIIDSDLGTGGAYSDGYCGPKQVTFNGQTSNSIWGDEGYFQMINSGGPGGNCGVTDNSALWLEYSGGQPKNYTGDIAQVFGCLALNLGTLGCGEEHQLQSFEFAFYGPGASVQRQMLRPNAYLGLVFLSDEDDCSAAANDGMFGDKSELAGESPSLRCSTRAYTCNGKNLTSSPPGYPTNAPFSAPWANCSARTDACPDTIDNPKASVPDFSQPTDCSPLRDYKKIASEIKALKSDPDNQILVAGIFGWPVGNDFSKAEPVKFDQRPNPNTADTAHPYIYDYWSLCYDPNHRPAANTTDAKTGFDADAWGWGAGPGLRESAFIDEFGDNGLKFSICETDYTAAMSKIGATIAAKLQNLCVAAKIYNSNFDTTPQPANVDQLGASCDVYYRNLNSDGTFSQGANLPRCPPGSTDGKVSQACWQLSIDHTKCQAANEYGQLVTVLRTADEVAKGPLAPGTQVGMQCQSCPDSLAQVPQTSDTYKACSYQTF